MIDLSNLINLLFAPPFALASSIIARITFITVLTPENVIYRFHSFDLPIFMGSSPMIPKFHGFIKAVPTYFTLVFAHSSCLFFLILHLFPFIKMVIPNMPV